MLMRVFYQVGYPCMKWACLSLSSDDAISLGFESAKRASEMKSDGS